MHAPTTSKDCAKNFRLWNQLERRALLNWHVKLPYMFRESLVGHARCGPRATFLFICSVWETRSPTMPSCLHGISCGNVTSLLCPVHEKREVRTVKCWDRRRNLQMPMAGKEPSAYLRRWYSGDMPRLPSVEGPYMKEKKK
jgi:hypothetical protein